MDNTVLYKTRLVAAGNVADILIFQYTQQLFKNLNDKLHYYELKRNSSL